jgi:hypothetical protein
MLPHPPACGDLLSVPDPECAFRSIRKLAGKRGLANLSCANQRDDGRAC